MWLSIQEIKSWKSKVMVILRTPDSVGVKEQFVVTSPDGWVIVVEPMNSVSVSTVTVAVAINIEPSFKRSPYLESLTIDRYVFLSLQSIIQILCHSDYRVPMNQYPTEQRKEAKEQLE